MGAHTSRGAFWHYLSLSFTHSHSVSLSAHFGHSPHSALTEAAATLTLHRVHTCAGCVCVCSLALQMCAVQVWERYAKRFAKALVPDEETEAGATTAGATTAVATSTPSPATPQGTPTAYVTGQAQGGGAKQLTPSSGSGPGALISPYSAPTPTGTPAAAAGRVPASAMPTGTASVAIAQAVREAEERMKTSVEGGFAALRRELGLRVAAEETVHAHFGDGFSAD